MLVFLLLWLSAGQPVSAPATADRVTLAVRIHVDPRLDRGEVEQAQDMAMRLLAAAGIDLTWRICDSPQDCGPTAGALPEVYVILSAQDLTGRLENCGRAAVGAGPGDGTVRISVPCVLRVAERLAIGQGSGPTHPLLLVARYDDLLGAVEAHEIGHVLGLSHGDGVMRARLDPTDVVALRQGTLAFAAADGVRMRQAVQGSTR